jgi:long-chain acyl-CoA synthetase
MTTSLHTFDTSDRPWLDHYPEIVPRTLEYPELFAWGLLERTASRHPDRIACHYYQQAVTYRELAENARRTASALVKFGVKPGDRVGVLLPNLPEYLSVLNGIWMAGGIAVAMSPLMVAEEVDTFMTTTDCRVVIGLDMLAPLIVKAKYKPEHILFATLGDRLPAWQRVGYAFARLQRLGFWPAPDHPTHHSLEDQVAAGDPDFQPVQADSIDEPAYILPTGGTTGAPKAVTLSHRNLIANAWQIYNWGGAYEAREKILTVLPFFHSYGLTSCAMSGVAMAATLVIHHRFVPRIVLRLIEEHQPSIFSAVPAMLAALNDVLRDKPIQFKALRYVVSGGAPLSDEIADEFARYSGATLVEGYGMSEASPVICTGPLDGTNRPGTIGLPLPDTEVRVVDGENGQDVLPPGEIGELVVRGPQVMLGYWQNDSATVEVIRDGWLFTGDMGTCDEDGFFKVVDRKKDLVITSGFNVYPADVEPVLKDAPGVEDVVIVGEPDVKCGEVVKAVISVRSAEAFDRAAFDAFAVEHLAKYKRPRLVEVVVGELPKNFLGKVLRRKLRSDADPGEESRDREQSPESTVSIAGVAPGFDPAATHLPATDLKE